jgi:hypothetical protein
MMTKKFTFMVLAILIYSNLLCGYAQKLTYTEITPATRGKAHRFLNFANTFYTGRDPYWYSADIELNIIDLYLRTKKLKVLNYDEFDTFSLDRFSVITGFSIMADGSSGELFESSISYGTSIGFRYFINNAFSLLVAYKYVNGSAHECKKELKPDYQDPEQIDPCLNFIRKRTGNDSINSLSYGELSMHTGRLLLEFGNAVRVFSGIELRGTSEAKGYAQPELWTPSFGFSFNPW